MFILEANKTLLTLIQRELITSGSVNVYPVRFEFSEEWDGLTRTVIFRAGTESRSVLLGDDNQTDIPWEVLGKPHTHLFCGVYGTKDGDTVLPTIWADLGNIWRGTELTGEPSQPPTPDIWEQKLNAKGDRLEYDGLNLSLMSGTKTLSSVQIAGGGSDGKPGQPGERGETGPQGDPGPGVPVGGTAGQILVKRSDGPYDTAWEDNTADKVKFTSEVGIESNNVKGAIEELFTSVSNGKKLIASAITDKGVPTDKDAAFETMAENIDEIGSVPEGVYKIDLTSNPEKGGTVSGGGYASAGMICGAKAKPNSGYIFKNWTEGGTVIDSNDLYSFTVSAGRSLTANFMIPTYIAGRDWFTVPMKSLKSLRGIAYGNGRFVVLNRSSKYAAYSDDGFNWTEVEGLPVSTLWNSLTFGNGNFFAVAGNNAAFAYSSDGKTWQTKTLPSASRWGSVTWSPYAIVATAIGAASAYSTDEGNTWNTASMPANANWYTSAYGDGKFVVVSADGQIAYSTTNGATWEDAILPGSATLRWYGVTYGGGKFVTVASTGEIAYSIDGITWKFANFTSSAQLQGIAYGKDRFVAFSPTTKKSAYSYDGINWNESPQFPITGSLDQVGIAYGDGKFVAATSGASQIAVSYDGDEVPPR